MNTRAIIEDESARDFLLRQIKLGRMQSNRKWQLLYHKPRPWDGAWVTRFYILLHGYAFDLFIAQRDRGILSRADLSAYASEAMMRASGNILWTVSFYLPNAPDEEQVAQVEKEALVRAEKWAYQHPRHE